jgi:hypothetical protein
MNERLRWFDAIAAVQPAKVAAAESQADCVALGEKQALESAAG